MNGLEALKSIRPCANTCGDYDPYCDIIEKDLKDGEKHKKALEIIKEKKVNLEYLKCCETYDQYKTICSYWNEITKEDFDFMKEVLK